MHDDDSLQVGGQSRRGRERERDSVYVSVYDNGYRNRIKNINCNFLLIRSGRQVWQLVSVQLLFAGTVGRFRLKLPVVSADFNSEILCFDPLPNYSAVRHYWNEQYRTLNPNRSAGSEYENRVPVVRGCYVSYTKAGWTTTRRKSKNETITGRRADGLNRGY